MLTKRPYLVIALILNLLLAANFSEAKTPKIQLANIYHDNIDISNYLVSEKLDGIRAYWDGKNLISRQGNIFAAPNWFTAKFPKTHLEGELWISRGNFELTSSIVRKKSGNKNDWQKIRFMIFDLPKSKEIFAKRFKQMKEITKKSQSKYLKTIKQKEIKNQKTLMRKLDQIVKNGGEGLMLHRKNSKYKATRNNNILKLKTFQDAEAKIIAHIPGKGKYQGLLGSILVENKEKIRFKIGSGFSDAQRKSPPKIGSIITYKFYSKTKNNKPRFASFMRVRKEASW